MSTGLFVVVDAIDAIAASAVKAVGALKAAEAAQKDVMSSGGGSSSGGSSGGGTNAGWGGSGLAFGKTTVTPSGPSGDLILELQMLRGRR